MSKMYNYRFVAQITLEAVTPLKTASGQSDFFVDAPVLKDWNGLPMILGTSIAGVLRKEFQESEADEIFGQDNGSRVLISNAHLLDETQKLHSTLGISPKSDFLQKYENLPIREHTAIDERGVAKERSKFDEEVVFAGSRFKFEMEFLGDKEEDEAIWQRLLSLINSPLFRLGGGSTKGFGEIKVVSCFESSYIIGKDYQDKPSDLNIQKGIDVKDTIQKSNQEYTIYKITLEPDSFFSFGAGFGDDEVDDIPVTEEIAKWDKEKGYFSDKQILLPASSLKGALSHRVAYHYNRLEENFADNIPVEEFENYIGENNLAVATIFGASKGHQYEKKGKALFSDMFKEFKSDEVKIFDHVKIDRFTGGAIDSALYNEKVIAKKDKWEIEIVLVDDLNDNIKEAFKATLEDLCNGLLPLGGKVNRGHGIFVGEWNEDKSNDSK